MDRRLLLIAFFFPPLGGAGSQRPSKFVKYLPAYGWNTVVLTSNSTDYHAVDPHLQDELGGSPFELVRTGLFELKPLYEWMYKFRLDVFARKLRQQETRFSLPDRRIGWLPFAYFAGLRAIKTHKIEVICSTSAPFTCHLVGGLLKKRTGLPWVADFRDEWTDTPYFQYGSVARRINAALETAVLKNADLVVCVNDELSHLMGAKRPPAEGAKFVTITNGYDEEDIGSALAAAKPNPSRFVITHVGAFYGSRTPEVFLRVVAELVARRKMDARDLEIRFVGGSPDSHLVASLGLEPTVISTDGFVGHQQALKHMAESTVLLLIVRRELPRHVSTGKVFEYLAMRKPILALCSRACHAGQLVESARSGTVVEADAPDSISNAVLDLYTRWKQHSLGIDSDRAQIDQYNRKALAGSLAAQLDALAARKYHGLHSTSKVA